MTNEWEIKNKQSPIYHLEQDGSLTLRGTGWQMVCPKGHPLHLFSLGSKWPQPTNIPCAKCKTLYPARL